jgi:hypothetical protein
VKPIKRTVTLPTLFGEREVEAEVWGGWVVVHRSWAAADKSPWVVAVLPSGQYVARCRLKAEARVIAIDAAEKYAHAGELSNDAADFCERHGINRGPIGPARTFVGYTRCHIGHREVWE